MNRDSFTLHGRAYFKCRVRIKFPSLHSVWKILYILYYIMIHVKEFIYPQNIWTLKRRGFFSCIARYGIQNFTSLVRCSGLEGHLETLPCRRLASLSKAVISELWRYSACFSVWEWITLTNTLFRLLLSREHSSSCLVIFLLSYIYLKAWPHILVITMKCLIASSPAVSSFVFVFFVIVLYMTMRVELSIHNRIECEQIWPVIIIIIMSVVVKWTT